MPEPTRNRKFKMPTSTIRPDEKPTEENLLTNLEALRKLKEMGYDFIYEMPRGSLLTIDYKLDRTEASRTSEFLIGTAQSGYDETAVYRYRGISEKPEPRYKFYTRDGLIIKIANELDLLP